MDERLNGLVIIGLAAWLLGIIVVFFADFSKLGIAIPALDNIVTLVLATLLAFLLSILFFGRSAFIVMFLMGLISGASLQVNAIIAVCSFFAFITAVNGGALAGLRLFDDFHGKENFYSKTRELALYLIVALIISIVLALLQPYIPVLKVSEVPEAIRNAVSGLYYG